MKVVQNSNNLLWSTKSNESNDHLTAFKEYILKITIIFLEVIIDSLRLLRHSFELNTFNYMCRMSRLTSRGFLTTTRIFFLNIL